MLSKIQILSVFSAPSFESVGMPPHDCNMAAATPDIMSKIQARRKDKSEVPLSMTLSFIWKKSLSLAYFPWQNQVTRPPLPYLVYLFLLFFIISVKIYFSSAKCLTTDFLSNLSEIHVFVFEILKSHGRWDLKRLIGPPTHPVTSPPSCRSTRPKRSPLTLVHQGIYLMLGMCHF